MVKCLTSAGMSRSLLCKYGWFWVGKVGKTSQGGNDFDWRTKEKGIGQVCLETVGGTDEAGKRHNRKRKKVNKKPKIMDVHKQSP